MKEEREREREKRSSIERVKRRGKDNEQIVVER